MKTSITGLNLIKSFESLELTPYLDVAGIPTIGYGTIRYENGVSVTIQDIPITKERAEELLNHEVSKIETSLNSFCNKHKLKLTQAQFDALVSFCYNLGMGPIVTAGRSLNIALLKGSGVGDAMKLYCKVTENGVKKTVAGLLDRRNKEAKLYEQ